MFDGDASASAESAANPTVPCFCVYQKRDMTYSNELTVSFLISYVNVTTTRAS